MCGRCGHGVAFTKQCAHVGHFASSKPNSATLRVRTQQPDGQSSPQPPLLTWGCAVLALPAPCLQWCPAPPCLAPCDTLRALQAIQSGSGRWRHVPNALRLMCVFKPVRARGPHCVCSLWRLCLCCGALALHARAGDGSFCLSQCQTCTVAMASIRVQHQWRAHCDRLPLHAQHQSREAGIDHDGPHLMHWSNNGIHDDCS